MNIRRNFKDNQPDRPDGLKCTQDKVYMYTRHVLLCLCFFPLLNCVKSLPPPRDGSVVEIEFQVTITHDTS